MKTKKLLLAGALLFVGISSTIAQEIQWGVKAGANYSTLTIDEDVDYMVGFHAGVLAEFPLTAKFSLQPELLYSLEGAKSEYNFKEEEWIIHSKDKLKLGYFNLPVMAKYEVTRGLSLETGPQIGYLLSAKDEYEISANFPEDVKESGTEDVKDQLKKVSFGLNFGAAYEFQNNLFLQARYHLGLSEISDFDEGDQGLGDPDKIQNRGFQLSLGYKF
ncbi:MAG: porin family protein [Salinimicrobium sp.]